MDIATIDNQYGATDIELRITIKDALCKISGEPKVSIFNIEYQARTKFVDLRAVNKLIDAKRDEPTDLETLTQYIANELSKALQTPVRVVGEFSLSGEVELRVDTESYIL